VSCPSFRNRSGTVDPYGDPFGHDTVLHDDPEASQLVLQAAAMGMGEKIFVLDMGEPVRIVDMVHDMIRCQACLRTRLRSPSPGFDPGRNCLKSFDSTTKQTLSTPHPSYSSRTIVLSTRDTAVRAGATLRRALGRSSIVGTFSPDGSRVHRQLSGVIRRVESVTTRPEKDCRSSH